MMLPGKKPAPDAGAKKAAKPKSRLPIGRLFNPEIGNSLRPMQESTRMFVQLVAMVFASYHLFPRNHPALMGDPAARLTLSQVIGTARGNLRFTKEGLPQVLVFAAVIGCFGLGALALFAAIFSLFVGKAHAQGFAPFQPVSQQNDIALGWINYLFHSQQMNNYLSQYGQVVYQPTIIQKALITALGYYSDAILVVAAFILFYHLASMIVETAHHGVVMGKRANQIWAPIRLVVAVGLLVPVSSGLNCGQYIVIQMAEWGSNLASETWNIFVHQLAQNQYEPVLPNAPVARSVVNNIVMMEACAYAYNQYLTGGGNGGGIAGSFPQFSDQTLTLQQITPPPADGSQMYAFVPSGQNTQDFAGHDFCGHYVIPPIPPVSSKFDQGNVSATVQNDIQQARDNALNSVLIPEAQQYAQQNMAYFLKNSIGGKMGSSLPPNNGLEQIVVDYQNALQQDFQSGLGSLNTEMQQIADTSAQQGWVSAGEWFNTIARVQDSITDTEALLPITKKPQLNMSGSIYTATAEAVRNFEQWMSVEQPGNLSVGNSQRGQLELAEAGFQQTKGDTDNSHWMDKIFSAIDWIASWDNVWKAAPSNLSTQNFTLGVQFTGGDPLDQIAALGHSNIKAAYDIFDAYIALQILAGTGKDLGGFFQALGHASPRLLSIFPALIGGGANITGTAAEALGGVFGTVSVVFFTAGFMLAYFLPLIPFFKFLFGILSWIVQVLEAVIAVPLIALAHLNPEGDGLPGANGKQSYYFIFNLFLWPVLMVFGLIVGLLLFYLAASALNMMFLTAVAGTGGLNHAHITLSRIAYSIIYVVVLYLCANNAFKMVDWLPQNCIRWMGAQGLHHLPMGDPTELQSYMGIAAGYVDSKIVGSSGGIARAAGPGALTNRTFWDKNVVAPITNMTERGGRAIGVKDPHGAATKVEGALDKVWAAGQKAGVPQFGGGESTDKPPEAKPSGGDASEGKGSGGSTTGGSQRDPGT